MASTAPPEYVEFKEELEQVLFTDLSSPSAPSQRPTVQTCITHLKLLEAFHRLREAISSKDGLFEIAEASYLPTYPNKRSVEGAERARRFAREKRWSIYVARAAERFEVWWTRVVPTSNGGNLAGRLKMKQMVRKDQFESLPQTARPLLFTPDLLPPLDVLMVWHVYLLAPRSFLEDCLRHSKMDFWATGLPWEVIGSCFDANGNYQPGIGGRQFFESRTGVCWDNLMDSTMTIILCPKDGSNITCPWTTCADSRFREACPTCSTVLTHDILSVHRLRKDADDFMLNNHPMPGTVLSSEGIPHSPSSISRDPSTFPNRFIEQGGFMTRIATIAHSDLEPSMEDIRDWMQGEIERGDAVRKANNRLFSSKLGIEEEAALGRMLNCYWDNHSSFSTNLATAVLLHGDYVEKVNQMMWLKEESLNGRLWRGLQKFDRVFQIMKKYPRGKVVPTLDIQLAWDTYLLSPQPYYFYSIEMTKKLVDYTQEAVENGQHESLEWTKEMYLKLFGEKYGDDSQPHILGSRQEKERDIAGTGRWSMAASFPVASMEP